MGEIELVIFFQEYPDMGFLLTKMNHPTVMIIIALQS
jgi:hypothetical protein